MSTPTTPPTIGTLRVWSIVNPPNDPTYYPVTSPEHAKRLIDALADSQLADPTIASNAFGLEVYVGLRGNEDEQNGWEEWEDEDGFTLDDADCSVGRYTFTVEYGEFCIRNSAGWMVWSEDRQRSKAGFPLDEVLRTVESNQASWREDQESVKERSS